MEFRFNVQPFFLQPIIKIDNNLLPEGFKGDRRTNLEITSKISEIINDIGLASAKAQELSKPVTTSQKLRMSDHKVYLLGDKDYGKNGAVIGLLKIGEKSLYVFDENGDTKVVNAPCVLDFYIHESRQRSGLGKQLFERMLEEEKYLPQKMAVDRPSDKLLGFLQKHYKLEKNIPQMNNFVVYDGFFGDNTSNNINNNNNNNVEEKTKKKSSPNMALFGPQYVTDANRKRIKSQSPSLMQNSPVFGRYAAPRPISSMAEIIHNTATPATGGPQSNESKIHVMNEESDCLISELEVLDLEKRPQENETIKDMDSSHFILSKQHTGLKNNSDNVSMAMSPREDITNGFNNDEILTHENEYYRNDKKTNGENGILSQHYLNNDNQNFEENNFNDNKYKIESDFNIGKNHTKNNGDNLPFGLSKQHTGLKNISHNISLAMSPTEIIPHYKDSIRRHEQTENEQIAAGITTHEKSDQGYFDLKFYHNKLW